MIQDILEMAKPEIEKKRKFNQIITLLRGLHQAGQTDAQIMETINKMDLPLGLHLAITGNFSKLIK